MAGKFRGNVGKLSKTKGGKKTKGKKVSSIVKRSSKLPEDAFQKRLAELTSSSSNTDGAAEKNTLKVAAAKQSLQQKKPIGRAMMEVVGSVKEKVVPEEKLAVQRSTAEAVGLKILHQAVKNQSHNRLLPHQSRHDYEFRLRNIATQGAVQLFNSLAQARKAGQAVLDEENHLTADKRLEKKQVVSKEAFLAALRQPQAPRAF